MTSMFFKRGEAVEYIRPGSVFRRTQTENVVETATVRSVGCDAAGIPHVSYDVSIQRSHISFQDGPRSLALKSFTDRYKERVDA